MRASSEIQSHVFLVEIRFFSGELHYASETYRVHAAHWYAAEREALQISLASAYDNARIPDLRRTANASRT